MIRPWTREMRTNCCNAPIDFEFHNEVPLGPLKIGTGDYTCMICGAIIHPWNVGRDTYYIIGTDKWSILLGIMEV